MALATTGDAIGDSSIVTLVADLELSSIGSKRIHRRLMPIAKL